MRIVHNIWRSLLTEYATSESPATKWLLRRANNLALMWQSGYATQWSKQRTSVFAKITIILWTFGITIMHQPFSLHQQVMKERFQRGIRTLSRDLAKADSLTTWYHSIQSVGAQNPFFFWQSRFPTKKALNRHDTYPDPKCVLIILPRERYHPIYENDTR